MLKILLFDLDGTLIDSAPGIIHSLQYALQNLHQPIPDEATLRLFIGPPLSIAFPQFCHLDAEQTTQATTEYRNYYKEKGIFECSIYAGIPKALEALKKEGFLLCVASSKPEAMVKIVLSHFHLDSYFDCITGSISDVLRSNKAEVIEEVFRRLSAQTRPEIYTPEEGEDLSSPECADYLKAVRDLKASCLMIGDRFYDLEGAKKAGVRALAVSWGAAPAGEFDAYPDVTVVKNPEEMVRWILQEAEDPLPHERDRS